jgi:hypothetical protein
MKNTPAFCHSVNDKEKKSLATDAAPILMKQKKNHPT